MFFICQKHNYRSATGNNKWYNSVENLCTRHQTSRKNRLISIPDNGMQHTADRAVEWSQGNKQRLNASKTQYMMFSLQLNNKLHDSISIDGESIVQTESAKLLGVTIDQHLKFNSHIDTLIGKSRAAVHGLLTLKRKGVTPSMLTKYYQTCIFPIFSYASRVWHSHLNQNRKDKLESHQTLIQPTIPSRTSKTIWKRSPQYQAT